MFVCSIDLETTALKPHRGQILEFAAVLDDLSIFGRFPPDVPRAVEDLPAFTALIRGEGIFPDCDDSVRGDWAAMAMNADLIREIHDKHQAGSDEVMTFDEAGTAFRVFLEAHGADPKKVIAAGKNFASFDRPWIEEHGEGSEAWGQIRFLHRGLDPTSMFALPGDEVPPSLATCLERIGETPTVSHRALDDARDVVRLVRHGIRCNAAMLQQ